MKRLHEAGVIFLWGVAAAHTFYFIQNKEVLPILGFVFLVGVVGSVMIVVNAKRKRF